MHGLMKAMQYASTMNNNAVYIPIHSGSVVQVLVYSCNTMTQSLVVTNKHNIRYAKNPIDYITVSHYQPWIPYHSYDTQLSPF